MIWLNQRLSIDGLVAPRCNTGELAVLTLTTGLMPAKAATTLPHHRSLHQLKPQPP